MGAGVSYQLRESTSHFLPSLNVRALLNFMIIRNFIYVYNTHCVYINIHIYTTHYNTLHTVEHSS